MFFNEDLYLEADDMATSEPMTDGEIEEACKETGGQGAVSENFDFYTANLEMLAESTEMYYNLREKMMNIEHVAGLKAAEGLVSESETILSESVDSFLDKMKSVFEKIKNGIVNLFKKFVNFVSSLFVRTKDVLNMDVVKVWKAKRSKGFELKVSVLNADPKNMERMPEYAQNILNSLERKVLTMQDEFKKAKGAVAKEQIKELEKSLNRKIVDKYKGVKNAVEGYIAANVLSAAQSGGVRVDTVLAKKERVISDSEFVMRVDYAKNYKANIEKVNKCKKTAVKVCDQAIKAVKDMKANSADRKELQGIVISSIRQACSQNSAVFSKMTNVMSTYYRECVAIAKRVIGANNAKEAQNKMKKLGEGFDYDAYFA